MIRALKHFGRLYNLGAGLKRYGALAGLSDIDIVPKNLLLFLRIITAPVLTRSKLPDSIGERLALAFANMGPAYIKLGQTLATRPDVTTRTIAEGLTTLQDRLPAFSGKLARAIIEADLGQSIDHHFLEFDDQAVAAASIAQVHRAVTRDGRQVAVKVLRADIQERFNRDLALFDWLAGIGERYSAEGRRLKLVLVAQTVRRTVSREMDLRLEAAAASELSDKMLGEEGYRVPEIDWDRSGRRVLTLEWVEGIPFTRKQDLIETGIDLKPVARNLVTAFLHQVMRDGYFHGDLHQGNFLLESDGGVVALDFGIMGRLGKKERFFLAESLLGMIMRDYRRVAEVHFEVGYVPDTYDVDDFADALRTIADPILDLPVSEISAGKLLAQLFATTERFGMETRPELLHIQRSMVMAEGLALHLDPDANMWELARPTLEEWYRENLSPEVRLAEAIRRIPTLIRSFVPVFEKALADFANDRHASSSTAAPEASDSQLASEEGQKGDESLPVGAKNQQNQKEVPGSQYGVAALVTVIAVVFLAGPFGFFL